MDFVVYILQSEVSGKYYIGYTSNLILRIRQHNDSQYDKKAFTYKGRPWKVIHVEFFASKENAIQKENQVKCRGVTRYLEELNIAGRAVGTPPKAES